MWIKEATPGCVAELFHNYQCALGVFGNSRVPPAETRARMFRTARARRSPVGAHLWLRMLFYGFLRYRR
jgi:hypothetical protein